MTRLEVKRAAIPKTTARLIVVCGIPGSGKSTVARSMSALTGLPTISSSDVRAKLLGIKIERFDNDFTPDEVLHTYESMFKLASDRLSSGKGLIMDGFFRSPGLRDRAKDLAIGLGAHYQGFCVYCDYDVALRRLESRKAEGTVSPTGPSNLLEVSKMFEWPGADYLRIDNNHERSD